AVRRRSSHRAPRNAGRACPYGRHQPPATRETPGDRAQTAGEAAAGGVLYQRLLRRDNWEICESGRAVGARWAAILTSPEGLRSGRRLTSVEVRIRWRDFSLFHEF